MANRELSATQNVDVCCPVCDEIVACCVQYGLYDGVVTGCDLACHTRSDFPQDELEARAITTAITERHDHQNEHLHRCGYTEGRR